MTAVSSNVLISKQKFGVEPGLLKHSYGRLAGHSRNPVGFKGGTQWV